MPRIPQDEIERLKQEISVQRLAEARGIVLKPHGKDLMGLCPFHPDKSPSLVISPEKNLWNCLGSCGAGGSVIDWVMAAEKVSFRHAVEILREGIISSDPVPNIKRATIRKLPPPVSFDAEDRELLLQVIEFYHQSLKDAPEALQYLEQRGLGNSEMIEHFKLGYVNRLLGIRLPESGRKAGREIRDRLQRLGILRESGHEHFNGSIVFPIFDEHGHVSEIYSRKLRNDLRPGTAYHLYLPGPHKGVFNLPALTASPDVILCESIIDALTFWCAGFRNVTTSYGVNGFTPDILEALKKAAVKRVFIAYDRDPAGDKAAGVLAEKLLKEGFECFRVQFPKGLDANAYALKMKPPRKALDLVLRHAQWMGKGAAPPSAEIETPEIIEDSVSAAKGKNPDDSPEPASIPPEPEEQQNQVLSLAAETELPNALDAPEPPTLPEAPRATTAPGVEVRPNETILTISERRWRVRGLEKNMSYDQMKVNLLVSRAGGRPAEAYFVDTIDLYSARARAAFQKQAADELRTEQDVIRSDLGKILLKLEELQDKQIREALEPKEPAVILTAQDREEALELLKDPRLIDRILEDFEQCGTVGEKTNKLTGYLAAVSRKLITPLAVIIQSSSAAGKTSLMEAVLAFMPEEDRVKYSAMTGQSLFYMGETCLKHKILAIVEEEGAERASYALKLLQSEGELTIASTGKDPQSGRLVTHEYRVEGPVMIFVTTTSIDIDEELQNRCIVLSVDESREQTRAIHHRQRARRTLEGLWARQERNEIFRKHRNAQRLLQPVYIINPYAPRLTFLDGQTRTRRDHDRYLDLIEAITVLHQFQRPFKTDRKNGRELQYLEVTLEDIELANQLMHEVLGRSLDELPPQTRRLLLLLEEMVAEACRQLGIEKEDYRFSQRDVRKCTGFGNTQVKLHLRRLEDMEYIFAYRSQRGQGFVYELGYEGQGKDGERFFPGLLDTEELRKKQGYDGERSGFSDQRSGQKPEKSPPSRPQVMHLSGGGRTEKSSGDERQKSVPGISAKKQPKSTDTGIPGKESSYSILNRRQKVSSVAAKATKGKASKGNGSEDLVRSEG